MATHNQTGKQGEELAARYFIENGYSILHKNWRHRHWEIDLIAEKKSVLHFIEVKMRTSVRFGYPEENVTQKKIRYLQNAAEEFLYQHPGWKHVQFDILSITAVKGQPVEYFLIKDVYTY